MTVFELLVASGRYSIVTSTVSRQGLKIRRSVRHTVSLRPGACAAAGTRKSSGGGGGSTSSICVEVAESKQLPASSSTV